MADRGISPVWQEAASDPVSDPSQVGAGEAGKSEKKPKRNKKQKRKAAEAGAPGSNTAAGDDAVEAAIGRKQKKAKKKHKSQDGKDEGVGPRNAKKPRKKNSQKAAAAAAASAINTAPEGLTPAQIQANEQMRRALEEDQYSANGSIVDTDSDEEDNYTYRGETVRMDRGALMASMRKHLWMERLHQGAGSSSSGGGSGGPSSGCGTGGPNKPGEDDDDDADNRRGGRKKKKKGKRSKEDDMEDDEVVETSRTPDTIAPAVTADVTDDFDDRDGGSIFGQTTGSSNATWVECDKCKKWRRLRGVVDEKKLPSRWYCSMNKNDPERARCSAPEEEYETPHTPESAADARSRKHLRVWVRRLQCNEAYESRQPTLTRGRKRATASSSKEPYEWIRCCNPSCGKWRAILRIMDAKTSVIDRTADGEWYCVMNTWDEKTASCAAPQENLPAIGCPAWVSQDDK